MERIDIRGTRGSSGSWSGGGPFALAARIVPALTGAARRRAGAGLYGPVDGSRLGDPRTWVVRFGGRTVLGGHRRR